MSEQVLINKLPAPTFRWLKMNGSLVDEIPSDETDEVARFTKTGREQDEPLRIVVDFEGDKTNYPIEIEVEDESDGDIILNYLSEGDSVRRLQTAVELNIGKNSKVTMVQVQLLPKETELRNFIHANLADGASFELIQVVLSGGKTYIECTSELKGAKSRVHIEHAYLLRDSHDLDINYVANHYGKKTDSEMNVYGVMTEGTRKIFRGTIDFKKGCAGAVGNEKEDVLLLDDGVSNQTIPLILCAEEDVEGNHGASLGKLSEDVMFYLKSRGMSEEHIYQMMARARIEAVAALIKDEETRAIVIGGDRNIGKSN